MTLIKVPSPDMDNKYDIHTIELKRPSTLKKLSKKIYKKTKDSWGHLTSKIVDLVKRDKVDHEAFIGGTSTHYTIPPPDLGPHDMYEGAEATLASTESLDAELELPLSSAARHSSRSTASNESHSQQYYPLSSTSTALEPDSAEAASTSYPGRTVSLSIEKDAAGNKRFSSDIPDTKQLPKSPYLHPHQQRDLKRKRSDASTDKKEYKKNSLNIKKLFSNLAAKFKICWGRSNEDEGYYTGKDKIAPPADRSDWEVIRNIPDDTLRSLLLQFTDPTGKLPLEHTRVLGRTEGSYHHVVFLGLLRNRNVEEYVIRIPAHGTVAFWGREDIYMMDREVKLMVYLYHHTKVPVAEVLACNTMIGDLADFPFILMRKLPGNSAFDVWYDNSYDPVWAFRNADCPGEQTEKKRINFLRSLATVLSDLRDIKFDEIGIPNIVQPYLPMGKDPTEVGPAYHWLSMTNPNELTTRPTFKSTREYVMTALNEDYPVDGLEVKDDDDFKKLGVRKVLDIVFSHPVFNPTDKETFTIRHNDL